MRALCAYSAFQHFTTTAPPHLLVDGKIVAAAQEERFTRKKHDPSFPASAVCYCLTEANISADELDHVVFYEKPFLKFERLLETYLAFAPRGFQSFRKAIPVWLKEKLFQKRVLRDHLRKIDDASIGKRSCCSPIIIRATLRRRSLPHRLAESAILTLDGVGEWTTTSCWLRPGQHARSQAGNQLSAFARAALFRFHLLHRLQGQFRRVQGDGAGAVWPAEICAA